MSKVIENVTFGADPEAFVINTTTNMLIPAYEFLTGTKYEPESVGEGYNILFDNALIEGNIPPSNDTKGLIVNLNTLIDKFKQKVKSYSPNLDIVFNDSGKYEEYLLDHPEAKLFGCEPYNSAYQKDEIKAASMENTPYRVAGFHIHLGYDSIMDKTKLNPIIAKLYDLFMVIPSYRVNRDPIRANNYGGYGLYRNKSYGIEVRSMGGFCFNPVYHKSIARNLDMMINFIQNKDILELIDIDTMIDNYNITRNIRSLYKKLNINPVDLNL